jgi:hypothetical protein
MGIFLLTIKWGDSEVLAPGISLTPRVMQIWHRDVRRSLRERAAGEEEIVLKADECAFEFSRVERLEKGWELLLDVRRDLRIHKEPLERSLGFVVGFVNHASATGLGEKLHDRLEEVGVETKMPVELVEEGELLIVIVAVIADGSADNGVVFLFDIATVVLAVWPTASKGDLEVVAEAQQVVIDELAAIVRVDAEQGKREIVFNGVESLYDPALGFITHSAGFCPSWGDIGGVEALDEVTIGGAAVMSDQIDLKEARCFLVPFFVGSDGDMMFQQGTGLRRRAPLVPEASSGRCKEPVDGGGTDGKELGPGLVVRKDKFMAAFEDRKDCVDEGSQMLSTEPVGDGSYLRQDEDDRLVISPGLGTLLLYLREAKHDLYALPEILMLFSRSMLQGEAK